MKINLKESLNKLDLETDNKYDLMNTYNCSKISNEKKKELAEALNKENVSAKTIYHILNEDFAIRVFPRDSAEYSKLESVADLLTYLSPNNVYYRVEKTYFDYGQGWMWTTIIARRGNGDSWQAISPKIQKDILLANTPEEIGEISKNILRNSSLDKGFNESLNEASYGGAYDIEDDMFFTKEDLLEFSDNICNALADTFGYSYNIDDLYMMSPKQLYISIEDIHGIVVESTFMIDMRKIRRPSDLSRVYGPIATNWFKKAFSREYKESWFDESLKKGYDGYNMLSSTLKDGGDTYALLRKTEDGKTKWAAAKYVNGIPDEDNIFEITYEQAIGFEPLTDIGKISKKLGKALLPKKENLKEEVEDEQLYKIVCKYGPNKWSFESALSYDDAEKIAEYYSYRWVDENGFEWDMEIEEDEESTERAYPFEEALLQEEMELDEYDLPFGFNDWLYMKYGFTSDDMTDEDYDYYWNKYAVEYYNKTEEGKENPIIIKESLTEDVNDLDLILNTPVNTKEFNDETFRALKNLVSEYKKDLDSLDYWAMEHEKEPFVKKWYKLADKCQEIAKNGIRGITGYGRLNDFIKLKVVDLARAVDNTFPWYTRNRLDRAGKLEESLNESRRSVYDDAEEVLLDVADFYTIMGYPMPKGYIWKDWEDFIDGVKMGMDRDFETVEVILHMVNKEIESIERIKGLKEEDPDYDILVDLRKDLVRVGNRILREEGYEETLTEDTVKQNGKWVNKGKEGTHGKFKTKKAADAQRKAMFANGYKGESLEESEEDKVAVFTKGIDGKSYYHGFMGKEEADKHYPDRLKEAYGEDLSDIKEINQLDFINKRTNNLRGIFSIENFVKALNKVGLDSFKIRTGRLKNISYADIKDEWTALRNKGWSVSKTWDSSLKGFGEVYVFEKINKNESLKEAIDDEIDLDFETDFDDYEVEEGNIFFEDGNEWVWEERIAGPIHLDFDNWAVWSAREAVDIRDFIIGENDHGGWNIDEESFIAARKSAPIVYFVVDEDTGFIDWGPVENEIEAKDFLNSKVDDWENDDFDESLDKKEIKEDYNNSEKFELYYDDIDGEKSDYYFEVPYKDVLEFLSIYAEDEENAPQNKEDLLKYVDDHFDRLYSEYAYEVLEHFYEDAEISYQSWKADREDYMRDIMQDRDTLGW